MEKWRLFLALMPPDDVREQLTAAQKKLKRDVRGLKWVPSLHITLTFLGDTPRTQAYQMMEELPTVLRPHQPCSLLVQGAGFFGKGQPRILWLGVMGEVAALQALKADVDGHLANPPYRIKQERRPYKPHITLARAKSAQAGQAIREIAQTLTPPIIWEVEAIHLMRSQLRRQGAEYSVVGRFAL